MDVVCPGWSRPNVLSISLVESSCPWGLTPNLIFHDLGAATSVHASVPLSTCPASSHTHYPILYSVCERALDGQPLLLLWEDKLSACSSPGEYSFSSKGATENLKKNEIEALLHYIRDHPFKTSTNLHNFGPLTPSRSFESGNNLIKKESPHYCCHFQKTEIWRCRRHCSRRFYFERISCRLALHQENIHFRPKEQLEIKKKNRVITFETYFLASTLFSVWKGCNLFSIYNTYVNHYASFFMYIENGPEICRRDIARFG